MELFKFTDEELSRVLSAHAGGQLISGGVGWKLGGLLGKQRKRLR
jgi:hypothetical protein